jgi:hypothetical protein
MLAPLLGAYEPEDASAADIAHSPSEKPRQSPAHGGFLVDIYGDVCDPLDSGQSRLTIIWCRLTAVASSVLLCR